MEAQHRFTFTAHFINREFVGQKALNVDNEINIFSENIEGILDLLWENASPYIKREVLIADDSISWSSQEVPTREELEKFIVLQDRGNRRNYMVSQINSELMRKVRDKHVNVFVYSYGKNICNKSLHSKLSAALLIPEQRDRANADSTVSTMDLVSKLKDIHKDHYSSNHANWLMWANYIQVAPQNESRDRLMNECPPSHLIHLFRSVPISESEQIRSTLNGLQITSNMIDSMKGQIALMRQDFESVKASILRNLELMEWRLKTLEEILSSNEILVQSTSQSLQPQENETSVQQELQIPDCDDVDHALA